MKWPDIPAALLRVVVRRLVPLLVAMLLGILADAGLLEGRVSDAAQEVLLEPSASSSSKPLPLPSRQSPPPSG